MTAPRGHYYSREINDFDIRDDKMNGSSLVIRHNETMDDRELT